MGGCAGRCRSRVDLPGRHTRDPARRASRASSARTRSCSTPDLGARRRLARRRPDAALTAFYMFRLLLLTFTGEPRVRAEIGTTCTSRRGDNVPLVVLACSRSSAAGSGSPSTGSGEAFAASSRPSSAIRTASPPRDGDHADARRDPARRRRAGSPTCSTSACPACPQSSPAAARRLRAARGKYWIDELYDAVVVALRPRLRGGLARSSTTPDRRRRQRTPRRCS